ncbi:MAG TPA: hypothetical protein VN045_01010 [Microbacteriaceae bacterium]|jgi:hypothetical protein|nr:hypothetical protein [Microbacteriaceae bacterium]
MKSTTRLMRAGSLAVLGVIILEAVVSLIARWPYQFNGPGSPDSVWQDFISNGTALAPPLVLIVVLALITWGVHRSGTIQIVAGILLAVLALVMIVGAAGELLAPASADVPRAVQLIGGALNAALAIGLFVVTLRWLVARRRARVVARAELP